MISRVSMLEVGVGSQGGAAGEEDPHVAAHDGLELAEDQLVHDGSVMTQPAVNNDKNYSNQDPDPH